MKSLFIKIFSICSMVSHVAALEIKIQPTSEGVEISLETQADETYFLEKSYDLKTWEYVGSYEIGDGKEHIEQVIESDSSDAFYRYDIQPTNIASPHDTDGDGLLNTIELQLPGFTPCCDDSDSDGTLDLEEFQTLQALYESSELDGEIAGFFESLDRIASLEDSSSESSQQIEESENKYSDPFYNPYTDPFFDYFADIFNDPSYEPFQDVHYNPANDPTINPTANPIDDPRSWGDVIVGYDPYLDKSVDDTLEDPFSFDSNGQSIFGNDLWAEGGLGESDYDTSYNDLWTGDSWLGGL